MPRSLPAVMGLTLALFATAGVASAHTLLTNPPPLTQDDNAKSGPCGCYFGGGPEDPNDDGTALPCPGNYTTTDLIAGSEITVSWKETVNHEGSFRLAISNQPVDAVVKVDLNAGVIYDKTDVNNDTGATLTTKILVPETPCESCTLQLRQTMTGAANPYYWSCASIRILPAGGGTTSSSASAGAGGGDVGVGVGAGAGGGSSGEGGSSGAVGPGAQVSAGAGMAVPPPAFKTGACSIAPGSAPERGLGAFGLLGVLLALRRKIGGAVRASRPHA